MASDGITILTVVWLDCFNLYGPGNFKLTMTSGPVSADGGVAAAPDDPRLLTVQTSAAFVDSCWTASLYYRVPDEFNRGSDGAIASRGVDFEARFVPNTGGPAFITLFVDLVRPPIVLVHGLWSSGKTWTFSLASDSRFPIREFVDYSAKADAPFAINRLEVQEHISAALARCGKLGILCSQVDLVGHSMGGLLSRIHTTLPVSATPLNRNHGNVRKLITLDSPHYGSPLATILSGIALDSTTKGQAMRDVFQELKMRIDQGAIYDLATGSTALQSLNACPVPGHALVGIGGPDALATILPPMGPMFLSLYLIQVFTAPSSSAKLTMGSSANRARKAACL
ncbi:MAG: alpha/beta fold hydrolase [Thermoanaerobaculia bacterium]